MKTKTFKTVLSLLVIGFFLVLAFGSGEDSGSSGSSEYQYCSTHDRMYHPDNAWKGCPDCVEGR